MRFDVLRAPGGPGRSGTVPMGTGDAAMMARADAVDVAAGRQVHHRVGAVLEATRELRELALDVARDGAVADVRVDLARERDADAHRLEVVWWTLAGMTIRPRATSLRTSSGSTLLALGDVGHLLGHDALAGVVHLRDVGLALRRFGSTRFAWAVSRTAGARVARRAGPPVTSGRRRTGSPRRSCSRSGRS